MSMPASTAPDDTDRVVEREAVESVVVRFAGDSGDGMQLTGNQFTLATALAGNDLATFPDFPAEIRAPAGTTYGVSAFQINFGARVIKTSGDAPDVLVAMNPAALKVNVRDLKIGGLIIADSGTFKERNLKKAAYADNPLTDGSLEKYRLYEIDISRFTLEAVKDSGLSQKDALRCKNMWTLGLVSWMYGRKRKATVDWLSQKFAKQPRDRRGQHRGSQCRPRVRRDRRVAPRGLGVPRARSGYRAGPLPHRIGVTRRWPGAWWPAPRRPGSS